MDIKSVCVYCGSSNAVAQKYKATAQQFGAELAQHGFDLVYGGGRVGLMGIVADAALRNGGNVVGIIPEHIRAQEVQHNDLTELIIVPDMHTRKRMMVERADAFVVLPGGFGTLDEVFEIMTWRKLKLHRDPVIVFNQEGYWDCMFTLIEKMISESFAQPTDRELYKVASTIDDIFKHLGEPREPDGVNGNKM